MTSLELYTKLNDFVSGSTGWLFLPRQIGPTWHISALLDFPEKIVSWVNCEGVAEISQRRIFEEMRYFLVLSKQYGEGE